MPDSSPETSAEASPEAPEPTPEREPDAAPEATAEKADGEAGEAVTASAEPGPGAETESNAAPDAKTAPAAESNSAAQPETEAESDAEPETDAETEAKTESDAEADRATAPAGAAAVSVLDAEPDAGPGAGSEPDEPERTAGARAVLRRWAGLVAAVVLVTGAISVVVADREQAERATGSPQPTESAQASATTLQERVDAVDTFLAKRSAAVLAVDERLFLEDVDPSATALAAEQRTLFANLVELGMADLRYQRRDEQFDQAVVDRHGPTTYLVRVWMTYRIKGVDSVPVKTELGYTFAKRGNRWMLVDDDDLDAGLTQGAHHEPWDLGRLEIHRAPRLMVLVDKGNTTLGRTLVAEAKEALATVDRYWPMQWRGSVLVSAIDEPRVRGADFAGEDSKSSASATGTYRSLPGEETTDGVFAGAYVVLNPAEFSNADEIVFSHEFTHVATANLGGYEPLWLAEGAAEYVSWKGVEEISGPAEVEEWEDEVRRDALPRMKSLPADQGFYSSTEDVYGVSWLAVRYLVEKIGVAELAELYRDIAKDGWSVPARDEEMRKHAELTEAQLFAALKADEPPR